MAYREHYASYAGSEVTTTSSLVWTNAATLNFTPANGRDFVLLWSLELAQQSGTASDAKYRVLLDGAAVTTSNVESRTTGEYAAFFGFFKLTGAGAARSVTVEIQSETSGQTTAIRNISLIALALGADDHFTESLGRTDVTTGGASWTDLVSMGWTPASAGDYLFLSSSLIDNFAMTAPAYGRFDIGWTSPEWPAGVAEVGSGQMNYVALGAAWVDGFAGGSPVTVKWQGRSLNNGNSSGWTDCRLLALRLDDFDHAVSAALSSDSSATSASLGTVLTLSGTASANPQLVVGAWPVASPTSSVLGQVQVSDSLGVISNSYRRTFASSDGRGTSNGFYALRQGYAPGLQSWTLSRASDGTNSYTVRGGSTLAVLDLGAAGQALSAATGTFTHTGRAATLRAGRRLTGAVRSCVAPGMNAAIARGFRLQADVRGYSVTSQAARVARGLRLRVMAAAFTLSGRAATLVRTIAGRRLGAAAAAVSVTGRAVGVRAARKLRQSADAVVWSRLGAGLRRTRRLAAVTGDFTLAVQSTGWGWIHILKPAPAVFGLNPSAAALRYSGGLGWQPVPGTAEAWSPKAGESETWAPASDIPETWS